LDRSREGWQLPYAACHSTWCNGSTGRTEPEPTSHCMHIAGPHLLWQQCGGESNCPEGVLCQDTIWALCSQGVCKRGNKWFWQCVPIDYVFVSGSGAGGSSGDSENLAGVYRLQGTIMLCFTRNNHAMFHKEQSCYVSQGTIMLCFTQAQEPLGVRCSGLCTPVVHARSQGALLWCMLRVRVHSCGACKESGCTPVVHARSQNAVHMHLYRPSGLCSASVVPL
jgi:hypothetical protein